MPVCLSYIVSADNENPDDIWVTEIWENPEAQQASLSIPKVKQAIETAMPLIASFESVATTTPKIIIGETQ